MRGSATPPGNHVSARFSVHDKFDVCINLDLHFWHLNGNRGGDPMVIAIHAAIAVGRFVRSFLFKLECLSWGLTQLLATLCAAADKRPVSAILRVTLES